MICQKCRDLDLKSNVYPGPSYTTLIAVSPGYYDENGLYQHNSPYDSPNVTKTEYSCSNGHKWEIEYCRGQNKAIFHEDVPTTDNVKTYNYLNTGTDTVTVSSPQSITSHVVIQ